MNFDPNQPWYHGSPLPLTVLLAGSTITQKRHLARIFSHKPSIVSVADDGQVKHNGSLPGYLYVIAEEIQTGDVFHHPQTTMSPGDEWLTTRELRLQQIGTSETVDEELLTNDEVAALLERMEKPGESRSV